MKQYCSTRRSFGLSSMKESYEYHSSVDGNPSKVWYWQLYGYTLGEGSGIDFLVPCQVEMEVNVLR